MDKRQQALLARDMIQMIREYQDDANALEHLESFAIAIARGIEDKSVVNWYDLAGICDQRYYSLKNNGNPVALDVRLLEECRAAIEQHLPRASA